MMITITEGEKIAQAAKGYIGTPHINQAKVKGRGVDCGMLLIASLEDAGIVKRDAIEIAPYSNEWHLHHSEEWFKSYVESYCDEISIEKLRPGDFLLYQYGRCCSHGAVYIGKNQIVHSVINEGTIISSLDDITLFDRQGRSRLRHVYRFRGCGDGPV